MRMHMPGHKGRTLLGTEGPDVTEIEGADELYHSRGIIRESEENAAALFGTGRTVYSAEGSSLCIRAMLYLATISAREKGIPRRLLAGRNAHRTLMTAAALLDTEIEWIAQDEGEARDAERGELLHDLAAADLPEQVVHQLPAVADDAGR